MDNFYNSNDNFPPQTPPYYEQPQRYQAVRAVPPPL